MLKRKALTAFKNHVFNELLIVKEHQKRLLLKHALKNWYKIVPDLVQENLIWENQIQTVVDRFRLRIVGPKILEAWKFYVEKQKAEQEKQKFKKDIWNKVNGWLTEIDEKRDSEF